jgi:hypothetical protein
MNMDVVMLKGEACQVAVHSSCDLSELGAGLVRVDATSPDYSSIVLNENQSILSRVKDNGASVAVKIWDVPLSGLCDLILKSPIGQCISKVKLADGSEVLGILSDNMLTKSKRGRDDEDGEKDDANKKLKKKKDNRPPWLQIIGKYCHSERQVAKIADLSHVKKIYRMCCCSYCAKYNPESPWAKYKPRICKKTSYDQHEASHYHKMALENLNDAAVSPNLPPWVQVIGKCCHSNKQVSRGIDLTDVKKIYRQTNCIICAKYNPDSPWAKLKPRMCRQAAFEMHESSRHHLRALENLTIDIDPRLSKLSAVEIFQIQQTKFNMSQQRPEPLSQSHRDHETDPVSDHQHDAEAEALALAFETGASDKMDMGKDEVLLEVDKTIVHV